MPALTRHNEDSQSDLPDPEAFWARVLSGDPLEVRRAIGGLPGPERTSVVRHLRRMAVEAGWQEAQRRRAQTALEAIEEQPTPEDE